tara:strand:+ start:1733 stop:2221 length:489 start_codon:yes stop_codon:yes gene_type:complete
MSVSQAFMVGGTALSAFGTIKGGKGAKAAADYNASIMERNAKVAEKEAEQIGRVAGWDIQENEKEFQILNDRSVMAFGKNGWMTGTGTPLKKAMANVVEFQKDMEVARYNTKVRQNEKIESATNMKLQAELKRYEGRAQLKAARTKAFGTLLSGASSAYGMK